MRNDVAWEDGKIVEFRFIFNSAAILENTIFLFRECLKLTNEQTAHFPFYCTNKLAQLTFLHRCDVLRCEHEKNPRNVSINAEYLHFLSFWCNWQCSTNISLAPVDIIWSYHNHLGRNVIIWDEMLSSGMQCYHLDLMLSSGTKCYHLG
jgi:hypothetical protein